MKAISIVRLLSIGLIALTAKSFADTSELQIFNAELPQPGESTLEINNNYLSRPQDKDAQSSSLFHSTFEYSYGIDNNWEIGVKLPATQLNSRWFLNGLLGEVKYLAPYSNEGFFWGAELELGYSSSTNHAEKQLSGELAPIVGYQTSLWGITLNAGLSRDNEADESTTTRFEPSAKFSYTLNPANHVGIEYFASAGPVTHFLPAKERTALAFLVWDAKSSTHSFNVGIGHGLTDASPEWALKFSAELEFD